MSLTEIINELPKLTEMERRMVRAKAFGAGFERRRRQFMQSGSD